MSARACNAFESWRESLGQAGSPTTTANSTLNGENQIKNHGKVQPWKSVCSAQEMKKPRQGAYIAVRCYDEDLSESSMGGH